MSVDTIFPENHVFGNVRTYVLTTAAVVAVILNVRVASAAADTTASFSRAETTQVPGAVLRAGRYTIQIVDHLSDRSIVRMDSVGGPTHVTFLGVNSSGGAGEAAHVVEWPEKSKHKHALRGFVFADGHHVEFVYPKAEAVALANANGAGVVAIDPASEGRPELAKLTSSDMQMVNLWMLTPVRVGPESSVQKGIEAKRYQPAVSTATAVAPASSTPVTQPNTVPGAAPRTASPLMARVEVPARPVASRNQAKVKRLPKTGSELPLVWLGGVLSFASAGLLRLRRACA